MSRRFDARGTILTLAGASWYPAENIVRAGGIATNWIDFQGQRPLSTTAGNPACVESALNGYPAINLTADAMLMWSAQGAWPSTNVANWTLGAVYIPAAAGVANNAFFGPVGGSGGVALFEGNGPRTVGALLNGVNILTGPALVVAPQCWVVTHVPNLTKMWVNGVQVTISNSTLNSVANPGAGTRTSVGQTTVGQVGRGKICETFATGTALSDADAVFLSNFWKGKFAL